MFVGGLVAWNINFTNSIGATGRYGAHPSTFGPGRCVQHQPRNFTELFEKCWQPGKFQGNLLIGDPSTKAGRPKEWPANNVFANNSDEVDFATDNMYPALDPKSKYKGTANDGRDPGADVAAVLAATVGVRDGVPKL